VKHVLSPFRAVCISFLVGACVLGTLSALFLKVQGESLEMGAGEIWMWSGGLCGSILVTCNVYGIPILGAAAFSTVFLSTQLMTAFVYDSIGALGFEMKAVSAKRISGVVVAVTAAFFFQFNVKLCPARGVPSVIQPQSKRASLRAVEGVRASVRNSIQITAEDGPNEDVAPEELKLRRKRDSLRL